MTPSKHNAQQACLAVLTSAPCMFLTYCVCLPPSLLPIFTSAGSKHLAPRWRQQDFDFNLHLKRAGEASQALV